MKKIIALVLALVMMASMSVVAFAAENPTKFGDETGEYHTAASETAGVDVVYNVQKGYVVEIPGDFDLDPIDAEQDGGTVTYGTGEGDVKILKARLEGGETLTVSATGNAVASTGVSTKWVLLDQNAVKSAPVGYTIKLDGTTELAQGAAIVSHVSGEKFPTAGKTVTLNLETNKTSQAGNFLDQLTFLVKIEKA